MKKQQETSAGDRVNIVLGKKEYEGVLLESPEKEKDVVLLKLDSGYNIGFIKKDIFDIELVEKFRESDNERDKKTIKKNSKKQNIAMIITGGTIAARLNPKKGGVDWLTDPESLFRFYPSLFRKVNVVLVESPFMKASEDMDHKDWQKLAKKTEELLNNQNIKGVIITHGTDFLHYTASALSFFLGKLNKPVVLTYSQRSVDRASSDASLNLECSALVSVSDIAEVMLVGHASTNDDYCNAMPGTKVRKMHSSKRDAFKVINDKPIAKVSSDNIEVIKEYHKRNNKIVNSDTKFEEKVALLKFYPGQEPDILDHYFDKGYKGIVLEMGALGHVHTSRARKSWTRKLKQVQEKGLIVCGTSQCFYGRTDPLVYSNGRELLDTGIIYLEDMLPETAYVKLGWVLGHKEWSKDKETIKEKILENFVGEFNDRLEE